MKLKNTLMLAAFALLTIFTGNSYSQSWMIGGNTVASGTTANDIGSVNNRNVDLITNNIVRMRIQAAGDVGIGITTPEEKLHVAGNFKLDSNLLLNGDVYVDGLRILVIDTNLENTFAGVATGGKSDIYGGLRNSFFGSGAGSANTYGYSNAFYGTDAGNVNTGGYGNSFFGVYAGKYNTTAGLNSFFGYFAGFGNTTGSQNSFFGSESGAANTTGSYNSFFGRNSGNDNTTGYDNSFLGNHSGYHNVTGFENSFFGEGAGFTNINGAYNSFFGTHAGFYSTGSYNSFFGRYAGQANTTAFGNTFIGTFAGDLITTGNYNTSIGYSSDIEGTSYTNSTAIGYNSSATASNQVRIGNSGVSSIGGYVGWSNLSDGRFKKNINENIPGLEFISQLRPISYTLDVKGINEFVATTNDTPEETSEQEAITEKGKIIYTGFIAQEVEKAARDLGYDFSGVDAPKNEKDLYGLRYAEFVVPLVKAVQELDEENETLKSKNEILEQRISKLESLLDQSTLTDGTVKLSGDSSPFGRGQEGALLGQNIPNPFDNSTLIPFSIPKDCNNASMAITESSTGKIVRVIPVSCEETKLTLDAGVLASGTYSYSLIVDGITVDTKRMEIIR